DKVFPNKRVVYDGEEHIIEVDIDSLSSELQKELKKYNISYRNNRAIEIGTYEAVAIISRSNYQTLEITSNLVIMKSAATTLSGVYQGSVINEEGIEPNATLTITQNTDDDMYSLAVSGMETEKEEVKSIMNINLFSNGDSIDITEETEIRLRIPPEVTDIDSLRLVYLDEDETVEMSYYVENNHVVFYGSNLGSYAFITTSEEALKTENFARVLFFAMIIVLAVVVVVIISAAVMNKNG
ncbi:MAG: hypothetical protein ACOCWI_04270, partial [Bacillota bacterium]